MAAKVVIDTNVYISAIFWGGKPREPVEVTKRVQAVPNDPEDDKFIECAISCNADYIVSGDRHLLNLKEYAGIRILKASEFLSNLSRKQKE